MLFEIFLNSPLGFPNVDGQKEQSFAGESITNLVHEARFVGAIGAPSGPEFQQNDFPFDRVIGEFFAGGRGGAESVGGFFIFGTGHQANSSEE